MSVNDVVDNILNKELNKDTKNKLITYVDDVNFKYNSFNICIGKQSTGKTTSVLKELIKMSLKNITAFHMIVYVSNNRDSGYKLKSETYLSDLGDPVRLFVLHLWSKKGCKFSFVSEVRGD